MNNPKRSKTTYIAIAALGISAALLFFKGGSKPGDATTATKPIASAQNKDSAAAAKSGSNNTVTAFATNSAPSSSLNDKVGTAAATAKPASATNNNSSQQNEAELCAPLMLNGNVASAAAKLAAGKVALAETMANFTRSSNEREAAFAAQFQASEAIKAAMASKRDTELSCMKDAKTRDGTCIGKYAATRDNAIGASATPIVNLALTSTDPDVYAAAMQVCAGRNVGACAQISFAQWAKLDPDNAFIWLGVANEAAKRGDDAAKLQAFERANQARGYSTRIQGLNNVLSTAMPNLPVWLQLELARTYASSPDSKLSGPDNAFFSRCGKPKNLDPATREQCEILNAKIAEYDETSTGTYTTFLHGKELGWSAEKLQRIEDESKLLALLPIAKIEEITPTTSCQESLKTSTLMQQFMFEGNRRALRDYVAKSGKSMRELAQNVSSR